MVGYGGVGRRHLLENRVQKCLVTHACLLLRPPEIPTDVCDIEKRVAAREGCDAVPKTSGDAESRIRHGGYRGYQDGKP